MHITTVPCAAAITPHGLSSQYFWVKPSSSSATESNQKRMATSTRTSQTEGSFPLRFLNFLEELTVINTLAASWTLVNRQKPMNSGMKFCIPTQIFKTWVMPTNPATLFPGRQFLRWCPSGTRHFMPTKRTSDLNPSDQAAWILQFRP